MNTISRVGIVEGVEAARKDKEVKYLSVTMRFETELDGTYYGEETRIDSMVISVPVTANVNPGDAVVMVAEFQSPHGARFVPALDIGEVEVVE